MKKITALILICLALATIFSGCGNRQESQSQTVAIGNPWSDWDTLQEAEAVTGFSFGLPEVVADTYAASAYRTLNAELIEVIYRSEGSEIRVRKQAGEDQDISGDYTQYDIYSKTVLEEGTLQRYQNWESDGIKQLISLRGYSWSMTATPGCPEEVSQAFVDHIFAA